MIGNFQLPIVNFQFTQCLFLFQLVPLSSPMSPAAILILRPRATWCSPPSRRARMLSNSVFRSAIRSRTGRSSSGPANALAAKGTTLAQVLTLAAEIRQHSQSVGLIVFSYLNPILRMGLGKFCKVARHAGLDGALITDLPVEEADGYLHVMRQYDLATVFLAAPTSPEARLKEIARASTGFVYAVSRTGVTGARQQLPEDAQKLVRRLRKHTKLPIAVGFGISTAGQFEAVGKFADAAVVGSAIVETIERNPGKEAEAVAQFVTQLFSRQSSAVSPRPR